jgi:hypothetical protein
LTIRAGHANSSISANNFGAGLSSDGGQVSVSRCKLADNYAHRGGGAVYASGATATFGECSFTGNGTNFGGGALGLVGGVAELANCDFSLNGALSTEGGAIHAQSAAVTLVDCQLSSNSSVHGGAVYARDSQWTMEDCTLATNTSSASGGGILLWSTTASLRGCNLVGNSCPTQGGGIFVDHQSSLTADHCSFSGNQTAIGGALSVDASVAHLAECSFTNNLAASHGGAAFSFGIMTVEDCHFSGNRAAQDGGALRLIGVMAGTNVLLRCEFLDNFAAGYGGAVASGGSASTLHVLSCEFLDNEANHKGSGLYVTGLSPQTVVADSTFHGNHHAMVGGAAIYVSQQPITIHRCVVAGNHTSYTSAAGIYLDASPATIENCTVADNYLETANGVGVGIQAFSAPLIVRNSILWGNRDVFGAFEAEQIDVGGLTLSLEFNCVQGLTGALGGPGNFGEDPEFWDAPGGDYQLRYTSPCIDAGHPNTPLDPDGTTADVGAFAFDPLHCGLPLVYCNAKLNSLGCLPSIGSSGSPSASAASGFVVSAAQILNDKNGFLFYGVNGPANHPFRAGYLCMNPPIRRSPYVNSGGTPAPAIDCSGVLAIDFNAFATGSLGGHRQPELRVGGTIVHCQWWSYDPGEAYGTSLSDALEFTICP